MAKVGRVEPETCILRAIAYLAPSIIVLPGGMVAAYFHLRGGVRMVTILKPTLTPPYPRNPAYDAALDYASVVARDYASVLDAESPAFGRSRRGVLSDAFCLVLPL